MFQWAINNAVMKRLLIIRESMAAIRYFAMIEMCNKAELRMCRAHALDVRQHYGMILTMRLLSSAISSH